MATVITRRRICAVRAQAVNAAKPALQRLDPFFAKTFHAGQRRAMFVCDIAVTPNQLKQIVQVTQAAVRRRETQHRWHANSVNNAAQPVGRFRATDRGVIGRWHASTQHEQKRTGRVRFAVAAGATAAQAVWLSGRDEPNVSVAQLANRRRDGKWIVRALQPSRTQPEADDKQEAAK